MLWPEWAHWVPGGQKSGAGRFYYLCSQMNAPLRIGRIELPEFPLLLAPMEDVSDPPFRLLCKEQGADLMFTEFISVEGLIRDAAKSVKKLDVLREERPIGIQIFGAEYDSMMQATEIVSEARPDLIDINFGCPVKKVVCKMAGAGILRDIPRMVELTRAVVRATDLPVTVKTRLGWDEHSIHIVEVAERLQDVGIQAITIHARTRSQQYKGDADWSWIARVAGNPRMQIPVFGNGDIDSPQKALEYKERYGPAGIMIGRAAIGNPWIFGEIKHYLKTGQLLPHAGEGERIRTARRHLMHSMKWKGERLGILEMRRHYASYFRNFPGIRDYRSALVRLDELDQLLATLDNMEAHYHSAITSN